ncbi:hypothetical protein MSPP1_002400 [Malassezia sp. CBS 17886]|nr:hypothetical protein MSPP1_002400 [Malassezia sp. CBS 17886]
MATYFDTLKTPYQDVQITDDGISTSDFIVATEGLVKMFHLLGNSAFVVVQNDMNGNIKKIRERFLATGPDTSGTLQLLVQNEGKPGEKKRVATEGLLWLLRGLDLTAKALRRSLENPSEELSASFTNAYENSLRQHHGIMLAMKACPYRNDFVAKLGSPPDRVDAQMRDWLAALERIVADMQSFYECAVKGNYAKGM